MGNWSIIALLRRDLRDGRVQIDLHLVLKLHRVRRCDRVYAAWRTTELQISGCARQDFAHHNFMLGSLRASVRVHSETAHMVLPRTPLRLRIKWQT